MNQDDPFAQNDLMYRQEISAEDTILGIKYEYQFAVIYLDDGSFYIDYPTSIAVISIDLADIDTGNVEEIKAIIYKNVIDDLKKAPHYTEQVFGLRYIPNPKIDPDYDKDINPFTES